MRAKAWQQWEDEVNNYLGLEPVIASGATNKHKGDGRGSRILVDAKDTRSRAYRLSGAMWRHLSEWARNEHLEPVLAVQVFHDDPQRFVVTSEAFYDEMVGVDTGDVVTEPLKGVLVAHGMKAPKVVQVNYERLVVWPFEQAVEVLSEA